LLKSFLGRARLHDQLRTPLLEHILVDQAVQESVGQAVGPLFQPVEVELCAFDDALAIGRPRLVMLGQSRMQLGEFVIRELDARETSGETLFGYILANRRGGTASRMAAIIDVALLPLADKRIATLVAGKQTPEQMVVPHHARVGLTVQDVLDLREHCRANQRLMHALEGLAGAPQAHDAAIKRIVEERGERGDRRSAAAPVCEPERLEFVPQCMERVGARGIQLERPTHQMRLLGVRDLGLAAALVEIAERRPPRIETLLQPAVHALAHLALEVADIVGGDDRLNVGGQPPGVSLSPRRLVLLSPTQEFLVS